MWVLLIVDVGLLIVDVDFVHLHLQFPPHIVFVRCVCVKSLTLPWWADLEYAKVSVCTVTDRGCVVLYLGQKHCLNKLL